ncbi:protein POOR HOMOLOGOUS SYNAPSIS 1 [Juglans microcarpa x Juglans regia]|uniref:protein POOR HOMOLOGOUS SYNAPSIS 1 n=1 Tax=Juglans microcarpa x Juglans regia TaxID=2249226 RepID=UPI001B7EA37B|nr:protein POOR HOMOLOGOUS SYNAPSIS 1 [Juglans microcarpa x Juglans regia]
MTGSLAIVRIEDAQDVVAAVSDQWEIQFARFFGYPPLSSTCPDRSPLLPKFRKRRPNGTWISSSSSAFLRLVNDHSNSDVILTVSLRGKILEQHYVSKLHFSWPHVSCVSGFPARGTRSVFVSYRDQEIQKFALRFSTTCETEIFINALKEILNDVSDIAPLNNDLGSEILSQTELMSSNRHSNRACEELSFMPPEQTYTPQMSPSLNNEIEQHSSNHEKDTAFRHDFEETVAALPPSFTSLLTNCCSEVNQAQSTVCKETDLKSQIVKYMEDSAFQDMLITVEKVISEMGGDLTL